ncbi:hypothetical protein NDU88_005857, partial [Pleurodeles waltl]
MARTGPGEHRALCDSEKAPHCMWHTSGSGSDPLQIVPVLDSTQKGPILASALGGRVGPKNGEELEVRPLFFFFITPCLHTQRVYGTKEQNTSLQPAVGAPLSLSSQKLLCGTGNCPIKNGATTCDMKSEKGAKTRSDLKNSMEV